MRAALGGPLDEPPSKTLMLQEYGLVGPHRHGAAGTGAQLFRPGNRRLHCFMAMAAGAAPTNKGPHTVVMRDVRAHMQVAKPMASEIWVSDPCLFTDLDTEDGVAHSPHSKTPPWGKAQAAVTEFRQNSKKSH